MERERGERESKKEGEKQRQRVEREGSFLWKKLWIFGTCILCISRDVFVSETLSTDEEFHWLFSSIATLLTYRQAQFSDNVENIYILNL